MRLIFISLIFLFYMPSCQPFSGKEKEVIGNTASLLTLVNEMRNEQISEHKFRMDYRIWEDGNKDLFLINARDKYFQIADNLMIDHKYFLRKMEVNNMLIKHNSELQIPQTKLEFYERLDTILIRSWLSYCKSDIFDFYAMQLGANCLKFTPVYPYISVNSQMVEQGQEYRANFFIGSPIYAKLIGDGSIVNDKVNFVPDQKVGKSTWKGKLIHFRDTIDIEIPYEIVDCQ